VGQGRQVRGHEAGVIQQPRADIPKPDWRTLIRPMTGSGPGCVKTLRGITAPEILRLVITLRAKKNKKK
jgi:hypothetical protein